MDPLHATTLPPQGWWKGLSAEQYRRCQALYVKREYHFDELERAGIEWSHTVFRDGKIYARASLVEHVRNAQEAPWLDPDQPVPNVFCLFECNGDIRYVFLSPPELDRLTFYPHRRKSRAPASLPV